jgi:hypothetical protein
VGALGCTGVLDTDEPSSRKVRLAALHSFFRYVAMNEPAHMLHCQRVLAIPNKRTSASPSVSSTRTTSRRC